MYKSGVNQNDSEALVCRCNSRFMIFSVCICALMIVTSPLWAAGICRKVVQNEDDAIADACVHMSANATGCFPPATDHNPDGLISISGEKMVPACLPTADGASPWWCSYFHAPACLSMKYAYIYKVGMLLSKILHEIF